MSGTVLSVSSRALLDACGRLGLDTVSNYFPLINSVVRLPVSVGDRDVTFAVDAPSNPAVITRAYAEYTLAAVFLRPRTTIWVGRLRFRRLSPDWA